MTIYCDIQKKLGAFQLNAHFEGEGSVLALLGASGSGKSMILRCIAGVERPDSGKIIIQGRTLFDSEQSINLPPQQRQVGLLFQDYALFPHMTVAENVALTLSPNLDLAEILTQYHICEQCDHYPHQLSGGQKQRCAIARMMGTDPQLVLLDEPFSALDSFMKHRLERELFHTLKRTKKPALLVSHSRDEVYRLSDQIAVISNGACGAMVKKHHLFAHPETVDGAILTGCKNIFQGNWSDGMLDLPTLNLSFPHQTPLTHVGIRANDIFYIDFHQQSNGRFFTFPFTIEETTENLFYYSLVVRPHGGTETITMEVSKELYKKIHPQNGVLAVLYERLLCLHGAEETRLYQGIE